MEKRERALDFVHFSSKFYPEPGWVELRVSNVVRGLVEPEAREQSARQAILRAAENWRLTCVAARRADLVPDLPNRVDLIVEARNQALADIYAKEFERHLHVELTALGLTPGAHISTRVWRWPYIDPLVHDMRLAAASVRKE